MTDMLKIKSLSPEKETSLEALMFFFLKIAFKSQIYTKNDKSPFLSLCFGPLFGDTLATDSDYEISYLCFSYVILEIIINFQFSFIQTYPIFII